MNERDSESVAAELRSAGFEMSDGESDADILLFNTCSVRDQAERKALGKIGLAKRLKRERPELIVGVLGCMAQSLGEGIIEKIPHVDFVLGTDRFGDLLDVLGEVIERRRGIVRVERGSQSVCSGKYVPEMGVTAFVALMRGCDRFCSYCIVPYVRGRERSRPPAEVVDEVEWLVSRGVREVMLLGQNVAAYGKKEGWSRAFAKLLESLNGVDGLRRIRFTSPHPRDFDDALVEAVAALPKVCDNIHLPLQSGSDTILKAMNRGYTASEFLDLAGRLRGLSDGITFSTDIIVGFPGETDEDFNATRYVMDEVGFENAFIFKYSPRRGTKASEMEDSVPRVSKEERNAILLEDLKKRATAANAKLEGSEVEVLVEGVTKRNEERWFGRTTTNKMVVFDPIPSILPGDVARVLVERSTAATLFGDLVLRGPSL